LLNLYGTLVVPEGIRADNSNILNLTVRAIVSSGLSAAAALVVTFKFFSSAHVKTVGVVFPLAVVAWAGFFVYGGFMLGNWELPLAIGLFCAAPALFVAYLIGRQES